MRPALALIDGEHYAPVVREALATLPYRFVAAHLLGGTEKLRGGEDYGVPLAEDLDAAFHLYRPEVVVDLSDEPVLGPRERLAVASRVLARGIAYEGPDFALRPPSLAPFEVPSISVVGTGKRVGKTAVTGHLARLCAADMRVVVVAMGRGGPAEPELVGSVPTVESLLRLSRGGRHAASDYLETAALSGVVTVGCRRCGGGLAGATARSNVTAGARLALEHRPELVVFDGSGAALPPVASEKRVLVVGANQEPAVVTGYLNTFRILVSDLVVLTQAERGSAYDPLRRAIAAVKDMPVIASVLRPRPLEPVEGRRVALFTTAPSAAHPLLVAHLREAYGAEVVLVSGELAQREALRKRLAATDAEVFLTEIKAAAIDVVAEAAAARGIPLVFVDNEVRALPGEPDLDAALRDLAAGALARNGDPG